MNILPYRIKSKNITNGVIITFVDITPRIRDLKEQEKMIAEHELLFDTISHDIKNPINSLGLSIEMIKRVSPAELDKFPVLLNNLESSLENIKDVVNGLTKKRFNKHSYQASKELIDLNNIIDDVRLTLSFQILKTKAKIILALQQTQLFYVRRKLRSVIYNLMHNAIKFTPVGRIPEITISSFVKDSDMIISISDNGIGISAEHQKTIFKKFERLNPEVEGTGVGLYLVYNIITSSGGSISVTIEIGNGSNFMITIIDALNANGRK